MKIGKKFLSLLMGVAVLLVSSLPAFAAEVETTDCASVSYDYVTEFDDGGKDYVSTLQLSKMIRQTSQGVSGNAPPDTVQ